VTLLWRRGAHTDKECLSDQRPKGASSVLHDGAEGAAIGIRTSPLKKTWPISELKGSGDIRYRLKRGDRFKSFIRRRGQEVLNFLGRVRIVPLAFVSW